MCNFDSEHPVWEKCYPTKGVVLSVGAHCQDCIDWFLQHGATKVIPIDDTMGSHVDSIVIDIEGTEEGLVFEWHPREPPRLELLHEWTSQGPRIYRVSK